MMFIGIIDMFDEELLLYFRSGKCCLFINIKVVLVFRLCKFILLDVDVLLL